MKLFLKLLSIFILATSTYAEESLIVSMNSIRDRVKKQNPDLAAARLRIQEARGRINQSGRRKNPELGIDYGQVDSFSERAITISLSQKLPLTNKLRLEKSVSNTLFKAAEAEVQNFERIIVSKGKELLIQVLALRQEQRLLKQQQEISEELKNYSSEVAKIGESSMLDTGYAKLETAQITQQIRQLDAKSLSLTGQLKALLGMPIGGSLQVSGQLPELPMTTNEQASINTSNRPDLQAAILNSEAAETAAALERAQARDDIEFTISAGLGRSEDAPNGFENEGTLGIGVKIPLAFWHKNGGAIEAADARKDRKEKEIEALEHNIRHEANIAHGEMAEWAKLSHEISTNLLPLAEEQADLVAQSYHQGQADLQTTFDARKQLIKLATSQLHAQREYHLAKVRYQSSLAN